MISLDDLLMMHQDKARFKAVTSRVMKLLESLGYLLNHPKSSNVGTEFYATVMY